MADFVTNDVTNDVNLSANQIKILKLMFENGNITLAQLSLTLSLTKRTIQRNVNLLQELKLVSREGNNKSGKWVLTEIAKGMI